MENVTKCNINHFFSVSDADFSSKKKKTKKKKDIDKLGR